MDKNTCISAQICRKTSADMTLLVDYRERRLAELLDVPHLVRNLAVGDLVCDYGGGNRWIAERKTASDLAQSIVSGRWRDQLHRLRETGCRIIFLVEGDLRSTTFNYDSLLGAVINAELRKGSCVIRTVDLHETAAVVRHLVEKGEYEPGMPPSALTPPSVSSASKRERDCDRKVCWTRMLMCVPSVSERIAKKLLDEYGSLPAIQTALQTPKTFKKVRLDDRFCLGKDRIQKLALHLTDADEEPREHHPEVEP